MTSRTILIGELHSKPYRILRKRDGASVGVATLRDRDRTEVRFWKVFIEDEELIERVEKMRVGESFACSGPFTVGNYNGKGRTADFRICPDKRQRASKGEA